MNNKEWNECEDALQMLATLQELTKDKYKTELQFYYIDCCNEFMSLLPHDELQKALSLAEQYARGTIMKEEVQKFNWYTESAVFSMDFDTDSEKNLIIYNNIKEKMNLTNVLEARKFAIALGYFVDWTSLYLSSFENRLPEKYRQFLKPELLRNRVVNPF